MSSREFEEVWDRDLMKQQLSELRKERTRLKDELARVRKSQERTGHETAELRRLVQDGHLREKHLRSRYQELLADSESERPPGPASHLLAPDDQDGTRAVADASERIDPSLVDRLEDEDAVTADWPTPEIVLPTLKAHPGWGNYASMGTDGVVIGISLLGLDRAARKGVIELVSAQQLRNPELFPIFLTDEDDFRDLRAEHFVFEYLPPWPGEALVPSRERWQAFLAERLALIKKKWGVRRFVTFHASDYDAGDGTDAGAQTVQRELTDAAKN